MRVDGNGKTSESEGHSLRKDILFTIWSFELSVLRFIIVCNGFRSECARHH